MKSAKPSILQKKAQREARWLKRWQTRNAVTRALWPVSWLFQQVVTLRRKAFLRGWRAQYRVPVPVIVIGGIMIGGVGKTPIVVQLVQSLNKQVISRRLSLGATVRERSITKFNRWIHKV